MNFRVFRFIILFIFIGLVLVLGQPTFAIWVDPTENPPGGTIEPPLNTSIVGQVKKGGLGLNCGKDCTVFNPSNAFEIYGGVLNPQVVASIDETGKLTADAVETGTLTVSESLTIQGNVTVGGLSTLQGGAKIGGENNLIFISTGLNDNLYRDKIKQAITLTGGQNDQLALNGTAIVVQNSDQNQDTLTLTGNNASGKSSLFVKQQGSSNSDFSAVFHGGSVQIDTRIDPSRQLDQNALSIYATPSSGSAGLYVEENGQGHAAAFSGTVNLIQSQGGGGIVSDTFSSSSFPIDVKGWNVAIKGESLGENPGAGNAGIWGESKKGAGVRGNTTQGIGVYGNAADGVGVLGQTSSDNPIYAGVYAESTADAPALLVDAKGDGPAALLQGGTVKIAADADLLLESGSSITVEKGDITIIENGKISIPANKEIFLNNNEPPEKSASIYYDTNGDCIRLKVEDFTYNFGPASESCKPDCIRAGGYCTPLEVQCEPLAYRRADKYACQTNYSCCMPKGSSKDPF